MALYGVSNASQLSSIFGTSATSFSLPSNVKLPENSPIQSFYAKNTATPSENDFSTLELKKSGTGMKKALAELSGGFGQSGNVKFNQYSAKSSDTEALAVSSSSPTRTNQSKDINVSISQLAAKQVSETNTFNPEDTTAFAAGEHSFAIKDAAGNTKKEVSVNVGEGEKSKAVLDRIAQSINSTKTGLVASVRTNGPTGDVTLVIESEKTSAASSFKVEDTSGRLMESAGLSVKQEAKDAKFTVNGESKTATTNDVDINGVKATLKKVADANLSFSKDSTASDSAVKEFVASYNSMFESNEKIAGQMLTASSTYMKSLVKAGFSFDEGGKMSISDDNIKKATENGTMKALFSGGDNYGFASRLSKIAQTAERTPQAFTAPEKTGSYLAAMQNKNNNMASFMLGSFYSSYV